MDYAMTVLVAFGAIVVWELTVVVIAYAFKDKIAASLRRVFAGSRDQSYKSKEGIEMLSSHLAGVLDSIQVLKKSQSKSMQATLDIKEIVDAHMEMTKLTVKKIDHLENKKPEPTAFQKISSQAKKMTTRVSQIGSKPNKRKLT